MEQLKASMGVAEGSLEASLVARLAAAQVMKAGMKCNVVYSFVCCM
jgi:hypothetical protein